MKKGIQQFVFLWSVFILVTGCAGTDYTLQEDKAFEDVRRLAMEADKPFCIVLLDSTKGLSKEYIQSLQHNYDYLTQKAVFNIIDISSGESSWYIKWLLPMSLPLTCVFSSNGQLIDLIPGVAKESFLYTDQAIESQRITEYHWPNSFQKNKKSAVPLLGGLLSFQNNIDKGEYSWNDYEVLSDSLQYPYADYLLLKTAVMSEDTTIMTKRARQLLRLETSGALELYKDEFIEARKILDPDFSLSKAPSIRAATDTINLEGLKVGQSIPIDIVLYNDGEETLKIEKINMSCTCVSLEGPDEGIIVKGKKSDTRRFYFKPENEGQMSRDIFILSNALKTPVLHIKINANVNP